MDYFAGLATAMRVDGSGRKTAAYFVGYPFSEIGD
jgi:hypothetical protein